MNSIASANENIEQFSERIEIAVDDTLFERNNGIVRDVNVFRADRGAAFSDIAITDALSVS